MHGNDCLHSILACTATEHIYKVHGELAVTSEVLDTEVSLTLGSAGSIHILLAYPYFIEVLIMLKDSWHGDLIRSFLISHLFLS